MIFFRTCYKSLSADISTGESFEDTRENSNQYSKELLLGCRKEGNFVMDYLKFFQSECNCIFLWKHGDMGPFGCLYKIKANREK